MDNIRFALLCALGVLAFMLYQAWQADYSATAEPPRPTQQQQAAANSDATSRASDLAAPPQQSDRSGKPEADAAAAPGSDKRDRELAQGKTVHVVTDKLDVYIDTRGGDLRRVALLDVPVSADRPDSSLRLINDTTPNFFIVQSGLSGGDAPDHISLYKTQQQEYELAQGQDTLQVPLTWSDGNGHQVTKIFTFHRGSYRIDLEHEISNETNSAWDVSQYVRLWRTPFQLAGEIPFTKSFMGVGWYEALADEDNKYRYEKRDGDKLDENPLTLTQRGGWIAMVQHYFLGAVVMPNNVDVKLFADARAVPGSDSGEGFAAGFISAAQSVAADGREELKTTLYIGPKEQDQLAALAPGLELTVDYGWMTVLAKPIFWVLDKLHMVAGNWGVSIILLTILIKLAFYKLSEKQYRAMARMRKFAPRMQQLREKYGDDKQQLQAKMMDLYKKEGFNPLAGCWPMLIQMPVFIALYWMLRGAVELRLASFLWLQDLSAPDPYYILPVIFGATMFLQQRLQTNVTMDPMQQRMMQIMPLGMAVFFAFFPAGLVLYYCTNTLLSIAQQWYIYRKLDAEGLGHSAAAK